MLAVARVAGGPAVIGSGFVDDDETYGDEPEFGHEPGLDDGGIDELVPPHLMALDGETVGPIDPAPAIGVPHRYRRSLGAAALAGGMIGLRDIIENPKDERPVVEQHVDEGDVDRPIMIDFDPDDPKATVVRIRPDV